MDDLAGCGNERHRNMYKRSVFSTGEFHKRRRNEVVQIRKQKRDTFLQRSRNIDVNVDLAPESQSLLTADQRSTLANFTCAQQKSCDILRTLLNTLCEEPSSASERLSSLDLLCLLSEICVQNQNAEIGQLAARIICLVNRKFDVSATNGSPLDALNSLLFELRSQVNAIRIDIVRSIGVFCEESVAFRNHLLQNGIADDCLTMFESWVRCSDKGCEEILWLVSQLLRNLDQHTPSEDLLLPFYSLLATAVRDIHRKPVQEGLVRILASIFEPRDIQYDFMGDPILAEILVKLFDLHQLPSKALPTLVRTVANVFEQSSILIEDLLSLGILSRLTVLMGEWQLARYCCLIIANICAEGEAHIQLVLDSGILTQVANILETADFNTRKEACYVVCNCAHSKRPAHLRAILDAKLLRPLCDMLTVMDMEIVADVLSAIECLLQFGADNLEANASAFSDCINAVAVDFEECGGLRRLEFLTECESIEVLSKAHELIETYYGDGDAEERLYESIIPTEVKNSIDDVIGLVIASVSSMDQS